MIRITALMFVFGGILWCLYQNQISPQNIVVGGVLLCLLHFCLGRLVFPTSLTKISARKCLFSWVFLVLLLKEIFLANLAVLKQILKYRMHLRSGVIAIPSELEHDISIVAFANSITLTPGTYTVYIAKQSRCLFVHCLNIDSVVDLKDEIKGSLEKPIKRIEAG